MHSDTFVIAPLLPILRVDEAIAGTSKARFSRGANPHTLIRRIEYPFARLPRFFSKNRTNLLKQGTVGRVGDPQRIASVQRTSHLVRNKSWNAHSTKSWGGEASLRFAIDRHEW